MSTTLMADKGTLAEGGTLLDAQLNIVNPRLLEVQVNVSGDTLWVNVNGICVFRASQVQVLKVTDGRRGGV
jgi:hypothetical protein